MTQSHLSYRGQQANFGQQVLRPVRFDTPGHGLPTHYPSASLGTVKITDMNDHHLAAAINLLAKAPGTSTTLAALRAEQARRA